MDLVEKTNKKENILKVAQNLFAKFGLSKTTIEDIARKARMGKASIYYYFKSKESIYKEVVEKEGQVLQEKIITAVNAEQTPQKKIHTYFLTRMMALKELSNYYNALRDEYLDHYSFIAKARQSYDVFETNLIATILQEGVQSSIFEIENITLTAEAIVGALKGLEYQWTMEVSVEHIKQNVDTLLKILFKGIEKR
ncbi:MAG TPA: TetR/AcrR family transcriptional regulator [Caldithrix sp.]|nr:TetR/AcrR family transcriptional regulator [Caldithrix sp.]